MHTLQALGNPLQDVNKLWSVNQGHLFLNAADRDDKITSSIKEKCNFKLKFVNDQQQLSHPEGFS
jgi:hypothetical protein